MHPLSNRSSCSSLRSLQREPGSHPRPWPHHFATSLRPAECPSFVNSHRTRASPSPSSSLDSSLSKVILLGTASRSSSKYKAEGVSLLLTPPCGSCGLRTETPVAPSGPSGAQPALFPSPFHMTPSRRGCYFSFKAHPTHTASMKPFQILPDHILYLPASGQGTRERKGSGT